MSTIIAEPTTAPPCPQWCETDHDWQEENGYGCICLHDRVVGEHADVEIRINAVEVHRGCVQHEKEGPLISIHDRHGQDQLTPEGARQIALLLVDAAQQVEQIQRGDSL